MLSQRIPCFSPNLPFLEKIFHPILIAKLEEVNPPFINGGEGVWTMKECLEIMLNCLTLLTRNYTPLHFLPYIS